MMFLPEHAIWKFANAGDELNDWLPYAEDLIRKWSVQNKDEIKFDSFQIILATLLLKDDLLPAPARAAFADAVWDVPARIVWTRFCNSGRLFHGISLTGFEG
jgi:hypothetical protein